MTDQTWEAPSGARSSTTRVVLLALVAGTALGMAISFWSPPLAVMGMLAVVAGVAIFVRPELGVVGFVAAASLLPFAVVPVRLGLSPTVVDSVLIALLMAWLYWAFEKGRPLLGSALTVPILLYAGLAVVAFVLGLTYSISPERVRLFLKSLNAILFFFSVLNSVRSAVALKRVVAVILACGAVAAAIALVLQYLPQETTIRLLSSLGPLGYPTGTDVLRPVADTNIMRAIGTSIDPNVLGGLMMLVASLTIGQLLSRAPVLPRLALVPVLLVVGAALLLTQSRSALGGVVVATVLLGTVRDRRLLLVVGAGIALLPFLPHDWPYVSRIISGLGFADRASAMRLGEYQDAINLISQYPWFGIGFGDPPSIDLYLGVSNMYLMIGQEMGLLGLASFLAVCAVLAQQIVVAVRESQNEEMRGLLLSFSAALASAGAVGLLDHYFVNIVFPHMIALFWLYVGLATVAVRLARDKVQGRPDGRP